VRRIQELRKSAELDVADRIHLFVGGSEAVLDAVKANLDYVRAETLATAVLFEEPAAGARRFSEQIDGENVELAVLRV
jgi:isoleucyl-tRNA synthetase